MKCGCKHETAQQAIRVFESAVKDLQPEQFEFSASGPRFLVPPTDMEMSQWFSAPPLVAQSGAVAAAAAQAQRIAAAALAKAAIPPEKACWIQTVLNKAEGEGLVVDGVYGQLTRQAIRRFQGRHSLQVDGIVGQRTETALVQAALNSAAQASLVPVDGVMGGNTRQEVIRFQSRNQLVPDGIVGPKTRAAMVAALGGRCVAPRRVSVLRPPTLRPGKPTTVACNKQEYERQVNQCVENAKKCVTAAYEDLGLELLGCLTSGSPAAIAVCEAKAVAKNLLALRRCRDSLVPCDQAAKRATNCP
jgi:hypothetical protein